MKSIKIECKACKGTGLYVGMAELDGAAVQCKECYGNGWTMYEYNEFTERKERKDVSWVVEKDSGICISPKFEIGGMSYSDWRSGRKFGIGMELREYTCPYWWYHQENGLSRCSKGCRAGWQYSACNYFADKKACWEEFDKKLKEKNDA
jgi:hypothetical protein